MKGGSSYDNSKAPSTKPTINSGKEDPCPVERIICIGTLLGGQNPSTKRREEHRLLGALSKDL